MMSTGNKHTLIFSILFAGSILFAWVGVAHAAATLEMSPASQTRDVAESGTVTLSVNTGGEAINAAESTLSFPEELITVTGITKAGLFSYWPEEPSYSNTTGIISFAGGVPSPGYNGSQGDILVISFTADAPGSGQICETDAAVLRNDGNGTDITGALRCASIIIAAPDVSPPGAPSVTSATHPNQSSAYANANPEFSWIQDPGVTGFSFILDASATTTPDNTSEGTATNISYSNLADGVWYFHIKAQNANGWGATTHYTVTIDSTLDDVPGKPQVSSSTHPVEGQWYSNADATLSWITVGGILPVSYVFDSVPITIPDEISEGTGTSTTASHLGDGVWYFHIRAQNANGWGEVTHFSVRVDTSSPTVSANIVGGATTKDTTPDLFIDATDEVSGIAYITVTVNGSTTQYSLSDAQPLTLSDLEAGEHTLTIRAYDRAGNMTQASLLLTIQKKTIIDQIGDTISTIVPEGIKNTVRDITKPIQNFISDAGKPVKELVDTLRANEDIIDITDEVAEPIARTAAAIGVATAVATLPVGLLNALFAFLRFGYLFLSPLFIGRRARSWGTVINSVTRRPLGGAVVRVFETEFNKMKESQISDALGRFGFLVEPGTYSVTAEKQGFVFPSHLVKTGIFGGALYTGGEIRVDDKKNPHITVTIPMDPDEQHLKKGELLWKRVRDAAVAFLESVNWPLLIIGTGVSVWSAVVVPSTLNSLLLALYALLIVLKMIRMRVSVQSFGTVTDAETKKPLGLAVVRIFHADKKTLLTTRITNELGKFSALVQPGSYYLVVTKPPYTPYQSAPAKLSKSETLAMDVELTKGGSKFGTQVVPPKTQQPKIPTPLPQTTKQESGGEGKEAAEDTDASAPRSDA